MKLLRNTTFLWAVIFLMCFLTFILYSQKTRIGEEYRREIESLDTESEDCDYPESALPQTEKESDSHAPMLGRVGISRCQPASEKQTDPQRRPESNQQTDNHINHEKSPSDVKQNSDDRVDDTQDTLPDTRPEIDVFTEILTNRLQAFNGLGEILLPECDSEKTIANSCDGKCLRMKRPRDIRTRIAQLIEPPKMHIKNDSLEIIQQMRQKVKGHYDVIIVTAASSNHYQESQALIKNLHDNVFPWLKNFTFIYYDLGLTTGERRAVSKYCRCQVLDYPFEKVPPLLRHRTCYTWKPMIIKAHYHQTNLLLWVDASMRFHKYPPFLQKLFQITRERGVQVFGVYHVRAPLYTNRTMYHFFGDEPCMYLGLSHGQPSCILFARDRFVERVMIEPWVACAMDTGCMCLTPGNRVIKRGCHYAAYVNPNYNYGNQTDYGMCHLYDQSAISIIIHKLYQEFYKQIATNFRQYQIYTRRGNKLNYFPEQTIDDLQ